MLQLKTEPMLPSVIYNPLHFKNFNITFIRESKNILLKLEMKFHLQLLAAM